MMRKCFFLILIGETGQTGEDFSVSSDDWSIFNSSVCKVTLQWTAPSLKKMIILKNSSKQNCKVYILTEDISLTKINLLSFNDYYSGFSIIFRTISKQELESVCKSQKRYIEVDENSPVTFCLLFKSISR